MEIIYKNNIIDNFKKALENNLAYTDKQGYANAGSLNIKILDDFLKSLKNHDFTHDQLLRLIKYIAVSIADKREAAIECQESKTGDPKLDKYLARNVLDSSEAREIIKNFFER